MNIKEIKVYHIFLTFINGVYVAFHLNSLFQYVAIVLCDHVCAPVTRQMQLAPFTKG